MLIVYVRLVLFYKTIFNVFSNVCCVALALILKLFDFIRSDFHILREWRWNCEGSLFLCYHHICARSPFLVQYTSNLPVSLVPKTKERSISFLPLAAQSLSISLM